MIWLELGFFKGGPQRWSVILIRYHPMTYHHWGWSWLPGWGSVRFLLCKNSSLSFPHCAIWKEVTVRSPTFKGLCFPGLKLGVPAYIQRSRTWLSAEATATAVCIYYLEFCMDLSLLSRLFAHFFFLNHLWTHGYFVFRIIYYLIWLLKLFQVWPLGLLSIGFPAHLPGTPWH